MSLLRAATRSSSPRMVNYLEPRLLREEKPTSSLGLHQFLRLLPKTIESTLQIQESLEPRKGREDPVGDLFSRLSISRTELYRYAHHDLSKNYTRNLIATDDTHFTLLLLVWNPGKESPIHDHPSDGCWMQVCQGQVQECRYNRNTLDCFYDQVYEEGQNAFITDSMGYHKVGNPSLTQTAMTLHLYCPPFFECKVWPDPASSSSTITLQSKNCKFCDYDSQYGIARSSISSTTTSKTQ